MSVINDIAVLLGIEVTNEIEKKLQVIEKRTRERLTSKLGGAEIPQELEHIVFEVTQARFNRIGQEGMASYSQEGESITFLESDFAEYDNIIQNWLDNRENKGRFKML